MSCSHCGRQVPSLSANIVKAHGPDFTPYEIPVLTLSCPNCQTILGVLHHPPLPQR